MCDRLMRTLSVIALGACVGGWLPAAAYLQIEEIPGESKERGYVDWIELEAFDGGVWLEASATGRTRAISRPLPLRFTKRIDRASPYLLRALLRGQALPQAILESPLVPGNSESGLLRIELNDVIIIDKQTAGGTTDDSALLTETYSFNYESWSLHYSRSDSAQRPLDAITATWDFTTFSGGITDDGASIPPSLPPFDNLTPKPGTGFAIPFTIADKDTPLSELTVTAISQDSDRVRVEGLTGKEGDRQLNLSVSSLFSGTSKVTVVVSDGFQSTSRTIPITLRQSETPYETYLRGIFGEDGPEISKLRQPMLDPDLDQIPTVTEFFLGTDAGKRTSPAEAVQMSAGKSPTGGTNVRLQFYRRNDMPELIGRFWASRDMNNWIELNEKADVQYAEKTVARVGAYDEVELFFSLPSKQGDDLVFVRLVVENTY